jgi:hypothetical protein
LSTEWQTRPWLGKPYWNQVCALNASWPWARYTTTDPRLMAWTRADAEFVQGIPPADSNRSRCNGASLFHRVPGAEKAGPGGAPLFMINANSGSEMYVGTYDEKTEAMTVVGGRQILDSSSGPPDPQGNYIWAAAGTQGPDPESDAGRLITAAWVRGGGSGRCALLRLFCARRCNSPALTPRASDLQRPVHGYERLPGEKDAALAQTLGQLQPSIALSPQECMGPLASFGPT